MGIGKGSLEPPYGDREGFFGKLSKLHSCNVPNYGINPRSLEGEVKLTPPPQFFCL